LVFRQLYEPLVRVDCSGRIVPALAVAWSTSDGGRSWTFRLRDGAVFWDGSPARAADVLASWRPRDGGVGGPLARLGTVTGASGGELTVLLAAPSTTVPRAFADPALAVVKPIRESPWPLGTGAYWIADADSARFVARPVTPRPGRGEIDFRLVHGGAEAIGDSADVLVTRDPTAGRLNARPGFTSVPLAWDLTYAVRLRGHDGGAVSRELRESLARELGADAARAAESPAWWGRECSLSRGAVGGAGGVRRVVYAAGDPVARTLARRIAALVDSGRLGPGAPPAGGRVRATPLAPGALAAAVRSGREVAALVSLPSRPYLGCASLPADAHALTPLVETRPHAVLRSGTVGIALEWDGTPLLRGP
jgi:hypothetical protein